MAIQDIVNILSCLSDCSCMTLKLQCPGMNLLGKKAPCLNVMANCSRSKTRDAGLILVPIDPHDRKMHAMQAIRLIWVNAMACHDKRR